MDKAVRTENIVYNEAGERGKGVTVHIKGFSFYSKSHMKKMKDFKQKQNLYGD